ncbi:MAG: DUF2283 domain-containing protein [Candidatus Heimdallarchaeota archaeon]
MKARKTAQSLVKAALLNPDELFENETGCVVHKKILDPHTSKEYLLQIFYQRRETELEEISGYRHQRSANIGKVESMWIIYDPNADALYIKLKDQPFQESDEVGKGIIVDYDEEGEPAGIEVLNASRLFGGKKEVSIQLAITES